MHRKFTNKTLLNDLRLTARKLGRKTISAAEYDRKGTYHSRTIRSRFGGWNIALLKAGLEIYRFKCITKTDLLLNLKRVWDKLHRQPLAKEIRRPLSMHTSGTYAKHFGSWRGALEAFLKHMAGRGVHYSMLTAASAARLKLNGRNAPSRKFINKSLRYDILTRDNYRCCLCGASPAISTGVTLHVDHIIPLSKGGETVPENLQTLCSDCNLGKSNKV